jgi:hypothetical protein
MAYGVKGLRKLQLGRESTAGVIQAATTIWRGEGVLEDTRETVFPNEDIGYLSPMDRSYVPMLGGKIALPSTPATFEQIQHIFEMGINTSTATLDSTSTVGVAYIYTYTMPTTSAVVPTTIKTYTIEGGDNQETEVMEYCHVTDFEISGKVNEAVNVTATIKGRQVALQAFTGAIAAPSVEEILTNKGKIYLDAIGGTIGTTQVSNQILSFNLKVATGIKAVTTATGNLYFSFIKGVKSEITCEVVFEHSTSAAAEKVNWRAQTPRLMRLQFDGSAFSPVGVVFAAKALRIDMAGRWEKFSALEDDDGDDIVTGTFKAGYNSTAALYFQMKVANLNATIP